MYINICIYIRIYVCVRVYMYVYMYTYIYIYTYAYLYLSVRGHTYLHTEQQLHACSLTYIRPCRYSLQCIHASIPCGLDVPLHRTTLHCYLHTSMQKYLDTVHYITLHYITLHYITLHYFAVHYITLHYITLHYIT